MIRANKELLKYPDQLVRFLNSLIQELERQKKEIKDLKAKVK